jgi:protein-S-isoprenylcysteine O-methyltransferase Ste14
MDCVDANNRGGKMNISRYQKQFGVGPLGLVIVFILFCLLYLLDRSFGHISIASDTRPVRIVGIVLIGLWICWHAWSLYTIRAWWFHDRLCTMGPFRFVRHPIYAGGMWIAGFGIALLFNSWIVLVGPLLFYPIMSILVRKEEKMMMGIFGKEYEQYAARTGRFFPRTMG